MSRAPAFMFTDPGVDDAFAFAMMATSDRIEFVGACASAGNVAAPLGARNLQYLASQLDPDLPVFGGREVPPARPMFDGRIAHGRWGLGRFRAPAPARPARSRRALVAELLQHDDLSLLSTGPMTDLADVLRDARVRRRLRRVVAMGGSVCGGNVTPVAEFNVRYNPAAAARVFRSGVPVDLVTIDLTQRIRFRPSDLRFRRGDGSALRRALAFAFATYAAFHRRYEGFAGCYVHDPTAAAALLWPALFRYRPTAVAVELHSPLTFGSTVFDTRYRSRSLRSSVRLVEAPRLEPVRRRMLKLLNGLA